MSDVERFLGLLWQPGDVREVRIPKHDGRNTASGYFDDPAMLAAAAVAYDGRANLYMTLNPVVPALLARAANRIEPRANATTSDADVLERRWILVDIDSRRPAGISATNDEVEAAHTTARAVVDHLRTKGWPLPITATSGNGYALLYPVCLPNDANSTALVAGLLRYLGGLFDSQDAVVDTTVSNASRIGALIGTMKVKGDSIPERPHRRSALLWAPETLEPVSTDWIASLPPADSTARPVPSGDDWVREWLERAGVSFRELPPDAKGRVWYGLEACPWHPDDGTPWQCGVGQAPDGKAVGKCFHDRGVDRGWRDFRDALGLKGPEGVHLNGTAGQAGAGAGPDRAGPVSPRGLTPFSTAAELIAEAPPSYHYVARPWLAAGAITELDGKPKSAGKTTLLLHMLGAVLDGQPFLGEPTARTPVVMLSEQSRRSLAPSLRALGLNRNDLLVLTWPDASGTDWGTIVEAAVAECGRIGARLLVVDTLSPFVGLAGEAENDAAVALTAMRPLQVAAQDHDLAVLVTRHDRKGGGSVGESGRGSNAWSGAVDCVMALRRQANPVRSSIREIEAISRRGDVPEEPLLIELTEDGYVALGSPGSVAFTEARQRVLDLLSAERDAASGGMNLTEIIEALELPRTVVQDAVRALIASGELIRAGKGRKGDAYHYSAATPARDEPLTEGTSHRAQQPGPGFVPPDGPPYGGNRTSGSKNTADPPDLVSAARSIFGTDVVDEPGLAAHQRYREESAGAMWSKVGPIGDA